MKYSIVIPAYNEDGNIEELVNDIKKSCCGEHEIILVDDNSSDNTPEICDILSKHKNISCIHRKKGDNGMGYALIDGTRWAKGDYIVWVMGDRSDKTDTIDEIVKKLDEGYDMVIGSRYMNGADSGDLARDKAIYSSGYTLLARLIFGIPVHDITNAFRGFRKKVFQDITLESGDFAISPEFAIKAQLRGYKLGEVPTTYTNRKAGKPKFSLIKMSIRYISLFRYRLKSI
ncbi:MAG: glycosyltransferase [Candidatus Altiarchaeota archaeon]|nr:glycosyltransferase [Candidatus Altiarchaeota archaeon]